MAKAKTAPAVSAGEMATANARGAKTRKAGLLATSARYERMTRRVVIELTSGYSLGIPVTALREITQASDMELADVEVLGAGGILHFESLDADYSVPALILEAIPRAASTRELARVAGSSKSDAKAAAARANGAKGGRPRKNVKS